jgi:hypothetical protein
MCACSVMFQTMGEKFVRPVASFSSNGGNCPRLSPVHVNALLQLCFGQLNMR